ncbi:DUF6624 domain-containing protein [Kribbella sp.]|uniref:DUF6624 domain-containing protein n=1 Tax=Kribbella sp. TaxID=1871183 RepID=UPI002D576816|nr:DUF6624 domain-containing protein [Kribbella sp.]HZX08134.1 DUF6624 domain-containing protein [Kribbella sp.]
MNHLELRDELLRMASTDQDARRRLEEHPRLLDGVPVQDLSATERQTLDHLQAVDAANTARMKAIIAAHGWPGRHLVGSDGAEAAWLLIQHADQDPTFQRTSLALLSASVQAGDADSTHEAYLTDRVLLAEGNQQLYGTEFRLADDGSWQPQPLADADHVDTRRRQSGLEPLDDYRKRFGPPRQ